MPEEDWFDSGGEMLADGKVPKRWCRRHRRPFYSTCAECLAEETAELLKELLKVHQVYQQGK